MNLQELIQTIKINEKSLFSINDEETVAISIEDLSSILIEYFSEIKQITYKEGNKDNLPNVKQILKYTYE